MQHLDYLGKLMNNHFKNYYPTPEKEFLNDAYKLLSSSDKLSGFDYRFLCWLNMVFGFKSDINLPYIMPPKLIDFYTFNNTYLFSTHRLALFETFSSFIQRLKNHTLEKIEILIGGSFTDYNFENPNDIDIAIIIPPGYEDDDLFNEAYLYTFNKIPKGIDVVFLPKELEITSFKVFSRLMCLGNKAKFTDKMNVSFENNIFTERDIIKIEL
jgi:hypothetical protein